MKELIVFTGLFVSLLQHPVNLTSGNLGENIIKSGTVKEKNATSIGNVTITFSYLANAEGHRYGAVFYVHNTNITTP